ncbi:MAG: hypothetical protein OER56_14985 [Hyphomicrobiales bacterium]|nr:hypothetical protein [Hyphomicrobiales bacterium]
MTDSLLIRKGTLAIVAILCASVFSVPAKADTEGPNSPHVVAGKPFGYCYARSVPDHYYLQKGVTQVFQVTAKARDQPLFEFDWYSGNIYLYCNYGGDDLGASLSLVRMGKWPRGSKASADELAMEFYHGGKLVGSYSTLDIAGSPDNVQRSVSHYRVIESVSGLDYSNTFKVTTVDGRTLTFDTRTGQLTK